MFFRILLQLLPTIVISLLVFGGLGAAAHFSGIPSLWHVMGGAGTLATVFTYLCGPVWSHWLKEERKAVLEHRKAEALFEREVAHAAYLATEQNGQLTIPETTNTGDSDDEES